MKQIGQRNTKQRQIIQNLINESERPLSIHDLVQEAQKDIPSLGQATVYRTVKILLENHEIKGVDIPGGNAMYEKADMNHHHHFKCRSCEKVLDLPRCTDKAVLCKLLPSGFVLETHEFTFFGICAECA